MPIGKSARSAEFTAKFPPLKKAAERETWVTLVETVLKNLARWCITKREVTWTVSKMQTDSVYYWQEKDTKQLRVIQCCNNLFAELGFPHAVTHMNCRGLIWAQYAARELRTKCSLVILKDLSSHRRHLNKTATPAFIKILILFVAPNFKRFQAIYFLIHSQSHTILKIIWLGELRDNKTLFFPEQRHRSVRAGG